MTLKDIEPRWVILIGMLAVLPIAVYGAGRSGMAAAFAFVNLILVIVALYVAMGPVAGGHDHTGA